MYGVSNLSIPLSMVLVSVGILCYRVLLLPVCGMWRNVKKILQDCLVSNIYVTVFEWRGQLYSGLRGASLMMYLILSYLLRINFMFNFIDTRITQFTQYSYRFPQSQHPTNKKLLFSANRTVLIDFPSYTSVEIHSIFYDNKHFC